MSTHDFKRGSPYHYPEWSSAESKDLVRQLGPSSRSLLELELDMQHDPFFSRPHGRVLLLASKQPVDPVETHRSKGGSTSSVLRSTKIFCQFRG